MGHSNNKCFTESAHRHVPQTGSGSLYFRYEFVSLECLMRILMTMTSSDNVKLIKASDHFLFDWVCFLYFRLILSRGMQFDFKGINHVFIFA